MKGQVKIRDYFARTPISGKPIHFESFAEQFWTPFVFHLTKRLRRIHPPTIIFLEPPVNERPPDFVTRADADLPEFFYENLVYCPHWYDGLTLIMKKFHPVNIDYLHLTRGHKSMLGALRFGYDQIRHGLSSQLGLIVDESQLVGPFPTLIGEIGVPFNMPEEECSRALDANLHSLERNLLSATLWNYCPENDQILGDLWNGENLSLISGKRLRCPEAVLRPFPTATSGTPRKLKWNAKEKLSEYVFDSELRVCGLCQCSRPWPKPTPTTLVRNAADLPPHLTTAIFVPNYHFEDPAAVDIAVTDGDCWILDTDQQTLHIFIGHPSLLTQLPPLPSSFCESCLNPVAAEQLTTLRREHCIQMHPRARAKWASDSVAIVKVSSWQKEETTPFRAKSKSILWRTMQWIYRAFADLRHRCRRLQHSLTAI